MCLGRRKNVRSLSPQPDMQAFLFSFEHLEYDISGFGLFDKSFFVLYCSEVS